MGCPDCEQAREDGNIYFYRMGAATVGFICCAEHFKLIRARLQAKPLAEDPVVKCPKCDAVMKYTPNEAYLQFPGSWDCPECRYSVEAAPCERGR